MIDISRFMNWFLDQIVRLVSFCFSILGRIQFNGVSLLEFIFYLIVFGIVLDLLVISVRSHRVESSRKSTKPSEGDNNDSK